MCLEMALLTIKDDHRLTYTYNRDTNHCIPVNKIERFNSILLIVQSFPTSDLHLKQILYIKFLHHLRFVVSHA